MSYFIVTEEPLQVEEALRAVQSDEVGGISLFLGTVRDHNEGKTVSSLEYEAYVSMAEKKMREISTGIEREIPGVRLAAAHRIGHLEIGDVAVVCAAAAAHRDDAFRACRLLIDRIKEDVPIWKREHGPDGSSWL